MKKSGGKNLLILDESKGLKLNYIVFIYFGVIAFDWPIPIYKGFIWRGFFVSIFIIVK